MTAFAEDIDIWHDHLATLETVKLPAVSSKVTQKLPRLQFVRREPVTMPVHLNVLDVHLRVDAIQRTLLTKLLMQGGSVEGTLDELHERLKVPVTQGDLRALFEQGYISLGVHAGVWHAEVRRP